MSDVPFAAQVVEWFADAGRWSGTTGIPNRLGEHVLMSLLAVAIATAVALPAGLLIGHARRFELVVVSVANVGRAVPSFGLLFLFVLWLGLGLRYPAWGRPPVVLALVLLAIPPILTN
ncbi:MAG TPA: ABC transporter permease, partial [Actinomycetota bacterium]|nr:ABC transporter permease [Actinomycetota bacterium]